MSTVYPNGIRSIMPQETVFEQRGNQFGANPMSCKSPQATCRVLRKLNEGPRGKVSASSAKGGLLHADSLVMGKHSVRENARFMNMKHSSHHGNSLRGGQQFVAHETPRKRAVFWVLSIVQHAMVPCPFAIPLPLINYHERNVTICRNLSR